MVSDFKGLEGRATWQTQAQAPGVGRPLSPAAHSLAGTVVVQGNLSHWQAGARAPPPTSSLRPAFEPDPAVGSLHCARGAGHSRVTGAGQATRGRTLLQRRDVMSRTQPCAGPRTRPAPHWPQQARCPGPTAPSGARTSVLICSRFRERGTDS